MDALEFMRNRNRMCKAYFNGLCRDCPAFNVGSCKAIEGIEELLPVVEQWSTEHPVLRNVDHVAELLEKAGYAVDKKLIIEQKCPPELAILFGSGKSCKGIDCEECRKWWTEEYKEDDNGRD